MTYFSSRDISAVALSAAIWAVLNWTVAPIFWQLTHLPILCDMIGTSLLILTVWWTRRPGAATLIGVIATILNFMLRPGAVHFLGFTAASIIFDAAMRGVGYRNSLDRRLASSVSLIAISVLSTLVAGYIIGTFFMNPMFLSKMFGGVAFFAALHGAGGLIGGALGVTIVRGLEARRVI
ncbi:MAG: hypothetical protein ACE5OO_08350 [Candidatus Bathyarchaeia archaeon]